MSAKKSEVMETLYKHRDAIAMALATAIRENNKKCDDQSLADFYNKCYKHLADVIKDS